MHTDHPKFEFVLVSSQWTKYTNPVLGQNIICGGKGALNNNSNIYNNDNNNNNNTLFNHVSPRS